MEAESGHKRVPFVGMSLGSKKGPKLAVGVSKMFASSFEKETKDDRTSPLVIPLPRVVVKQEEEEEEKKKGECGDEEDLLAAKALAMEATAFMKGEAVAGDEKKAVILGKPTTACQNNNRPLLAQQSALMGLEGIADEGERLKHDLEHRAQDVSSEAYDNVAVEDFGSALLRGMGWSGETDEDTTRFDVDARPHRLGLGAKPKPEEIFDKRGRPREGKTVVLERKNDIPSADEKKKTFKRKWLGAAQGTSVRPRTGDLGGPLAVGDVCEIVKGFSGAAFADGRRCRIRRVVDDLRPNHSVVELEDGDAKDLSLPTRALRKTKDLERPFVPGRKRKRQRESSPTMDNNKQQVTPRPTKSWLMEGIRVRVAKRSHEHFRKKGLVLDVVRDAHQDLCALLQLDNDALLSDPGLKEKHLETVLPKDGGRLKILRGPHRGKDATLHSRDKQKQTAIVQLDDLDDQFMTFSLDDVAEFVFSGDSFQ